MREFIVEPSGRAGKKMVVYELLRKTGKPGFTGTRSPSIHFGAQGSEDYTIHKDPERVARYIARHRVAEDWTKKGITTAGFWSRWLLWNLPTIAASARDIGRRFGVRVLLREGVN